MRNILIVLIGVAFIFVSIAVGEKNKIAPKKKATRGKAAVQNEVTPKKRIPVKVTAYSATPQETQGDPHVTASGKRVRPGIVALSRDLEREADLEFGDRVVLEGIGTFVFEDRLPRRKKRHVDIYMSSPKKARKFGVEDTHLIVEGEE